jgi:hypothetical protein
MKAFAKDFLIEYWYARGVLCYSIPRCIACGWNGARFWNAGRPVIWGARSRWDWQV